MKTCEVCHLTYSNIADPHGCPNQWRSYKAPNRKETFLEFTDEWHKIAGQKIQKYKKVISAPVLAGEK